MLVCPVLAGVLLGGCVVGPDYQSPDLQPPGTWMQAEPGDGAGREPAPDLDAWWSLLGDPLLAELVDEALEAGPDMHIARTRLREARARRGVAGAALYPTASASGSARRSGGSAGGADSGGVGETYGAFSASFDASWELDVFGGVRRGVEAARADAQASWANLQDTQVTLAAEVARNYVLVRSLQVRLIIAGENLESQAETLQLTRWRAEAGLVGQQDVEQARANLAQTEAQIPALETTLAELKHRLAVLLGQAPGALHARLADGESLPDLPGRAAVGIPAETLRQRPDVRVAERNLAAETARVGMAVAALYPSFSLSGSIGIEKVTESALRGGTGMASGLLAGITAPLFAGGRLRHQVEAQEAVRDRALILYRQTVLVALEEVENALVALRRLKERTESLVTAVTAARDAATLARDRYAAGLVDFQSVLDTQRTVLTLEDSLAGTRADAVLALIQLYKALGGGWTVPPAGAQDTT